MIFQATDFNIQEERQDIFIPWLWNSKATKSFAMHVCKRLVYISGTNDAYVMIQNVARGMGFLATQTQFTSCQ